MGNAGSESSALLPQYRTALKGYPSFWALSVIDWGLCCDGITAQLLLPLSPASFTPFQLSVPRKFPNKNFVPKSQSLICFTGNLAWELFPWVLAETLNNHGNLKPDHGASSSVFPSRLHFYQSFTHIDRYKTK